jgi:hypothetical protein
MEFFWSLFHCYTIVNLASSTSHFVCLLIDGVFLGLLLTCFAFGNDVVLHIRHQVQFIHLYNTHTYCDHKLYHISFWTLVIYYIFILLLLMLLLVRHIQSCFEHVRRFKINREEMGLQDKWKVSLFPKIIDLEWRHKSGTVLDALPCRVRSVAMIVVSPVMSMPDREKNWRVVKSQRNRRDVWYLA